jgi:hypothetical protein
LAAAAPATAGQALVSVMATSYLLSSDLWFQHLAIVAQVARG